MYTSQCMVSITDVINIGKAEDDMLAKFLRSSVKARNLTSLDLLFLCMQDQCWSMQCSRMPFCQLCGINRMNALT